MTIEPKDVPLVLLQFQASLPAEIKPSSFHALVNFVATMPPASSSNDTVIASTPDLDLSELRVFSTPIEDLPPALGDVEPPMVEPVATPPVDVATAEQISDVPTPDHSPRNILADAAPALAEAGREVAEAMAPHVAAFKQAIETVAVPGPATTAAKATPKSARDASAKPKATRMAAEVAKPKVKAKPEAAVTPVAKPSKPNVLPAAAKIAPRDLVMAAIKGGMSGNRIRILQHLLTLPRDFIPADDLFIAEGLIARRQIAEITDQLGITAKEVTARWRAMMCREIEDRHGRITTDGQTDLLRTLRWMAEREARADV